MSDQFHPDLFCQVHDRLPYPCPWCRIGELETLIRDLGISSMGLDMGGNHQAAVTANGRRLTSAQWDTITSTRPTEATP